MKKTVFIILFIVAFALLFYVFYFRQPRCKKICFSTGLEPDCAEICNGEGAKKTDKK